MSVFHKYYLYCFKLICITFHLHTSRADKSSETQHLYLVMRTLFFTSQLITNNWIFIFNLSESLMFSNILIGNNDKAYTIIFKISKQPSSLPPTFITRIWFKAVQTLEGTIIGTPLPLPTQPPPLLNLVHSSCTYQKRKRSTCRLRD